MKKLLETIEIVKGINFEQCHEIYEKIENDLAQVSELYAELYEKMDQLEKRSPIDFDEIICEIGDHYDNTLNSVCYSLEYLEEELKNKMPQFENKYDVENYLREMCYRVEIKELWEVQGKKYYSVMEHSPNGEINIYNLYIMDGRLYNENNEDIVAIDMELI